MNPCTHGIVAPEPCHWCTPARAVIGGTAQPESAPLLSLEDRVLVAISARGERGICEFLDEALTNAGIYVELRWESDTKFVEALERCAFGDDAGLPAQSAGRVRGPRHTPSSEPSVRQ
jgi:hypothetical protein